MNNNIDQVVSKGGIPMKIVIKSKTDIGNRSVVVIG